MQSEGSRRKLDIPHPHDLYNYMNQFVIGQEGAKRMLAVSVVNHYTRLLDQRILAGSPGKSRLDPEFSNVSIEKSNVLLIGPTGCGKTMLARCLADYLHVPFAIGDATTLTEAGYVGEDVENLLLKLIQAADWDLDRAEQGIIYIDEIDKLHKTGHNVSITRDVSGEGVQQALLKMIEGYVCNVPAQGGRKHPEQQCLQFDTSNILFICGGTFAGIEDIIAQRLGKRRIGFTGADAPESAGETESLLSQVQQDDLETYGVIPELIGRLPVVASMHDLCVDDLVRILTEPQNALLKQIRKLMAYQGVNIVFPDDTIAEIARIAKTKKTGARGLRSVVESFMLDLRFDIPPDYKGDIVVTPEIACGLRKWSLVPPSEAA